ncbi:MAG: hypothetical protein JNM00_16755, partial [Flavobacteriales bacterium]|nr:hypothetical protein [Flavobacteriales bacterium]
DPRDRLWVGTTDGISILDRETQTFTSLRNKNEADQHIANNSIRSLQNVNDRYMLIGTAGGLTRYDFDTGKSKNYLANGDTIHSLHGNFVLDIVQSDNNRIYVTTSRGFSRYDEDSDSFYNWSEYPELYKALRANTRCATVDDNGIIWISKSNGNLLEFHPDRLTVAEHQAPAIVTHSGNNNVLDMLDNGAILWMGTSAGLMKFDKTKKQFERITFPENNVPLMVGNLRMEDNEVLWFTGSTGLVKFNMVSHTTEVFKVHHGLPTNSFHFQRSFVTHDSTYCMASMHGVVMFKPENLKQLTYHPAVYITELRVLNEVVDRGVLTGNELSLDHDQNFFTVTLNAFDYLNKDIVQYAYMLEGLHEEWIYNGRNRQLSFLNVPGGNYVLKFKASTTDGIWPDSFQSMRIHIDTVFYKQWWFSVLLMALVAAIVFFIMKYRQQQRNKVESLRQKIASDLHDDIGATLSSIRMYSEVALSRNNNNEQLLERISDNARDMVDSMSDIVWAIKPGNDRMGDLQKRMENFALEMCGPSNIELT